MNDKAIKKHNKGPVTKALSEVRNWMLDCTNIVLVKEKLEDLKVVMDNFNNVHNAYHQNLNDEHCISESNEYSEAVNQLMSDLENEPSLKKII